MLNILTKSSLFILYKTSRLLLEFLYIVSTNKKILLLFLFKNKI
jgi:hypothetical protein